MTIFSGVKAARAGSLIAGIMTAWLSVGCAAGAAQAPTINTSQAAPAASSSEVGRAYRAESTSAPQALATLQAACDAGETGSCYNLGVVLEQGIGAPQDGARAAALYTKACDAGDAQGCYNLGVLLARGLGVPRDKPRAALLYADACGKGIAMACYNLGVLFEREPGLGEDTDRAAALYARACAGGVVLGCYGIGVGSPLGLGVKRDRGDTRGQPPAMANAGSL